MCSRLLCVLLPLVAGCASRTIGAGPDAVPGQTLQVWKVDLEDTSNSVQIMARNDGDGPVTVTELRLYSCTNLYQACGVHTPNVRVEPGQTVQVARLDPSNHTQRPRFGWEFRWRGIPRPGPVVTSAPQVVTVTGSRAGPIGQVDVEAFVPLVAATDDGFRCGRAPGIPLGQGHRAIGVEMGMKDGLPTRLASVQLDGSGTPVLYTESRGDIRRPPPGVMSAQPVRNPGPRTNMTLDLVRGTAMLTNQPVEGEAERVAAFGPNLLEAVSLGRPAVLVERMLRECGGGK